MTERTYTSEEADELIVAIREGVVCALCARADDYDNEICPPGLASRDRGTGWPSFELYESPKES